MTQKIDDGGVNGQRTICEIQRRIYRALKSNGYSEESEIITDLREAYDIGKKMNAKLRQYKNNYDDGWYEKNKRSGDPIDFTEIIHYIDIGLHEHAVEIEMFVTACNELGFGYKVYGIEANPTYIPALRAKFSNDPNISIFNYAVSDTNGKINLYPSPASGGQGSSIYPTKNNVDRNSPIVVQAIRLSEFMSGIELGDTNVLKYNIEGAELPMMQDLISSGSYKAFDIYCGSTPDIEKVSEIADKQDQYLKMLSNYSINRMDFYELPNEAHNRRMIEGMKKAIKETML